MPAAQASFWTLGTSATLLTLGRLTGARAQQAAPPVRAELAPISSVKLSGYLRDDKGKALIGATVFVQALDVGTTANEQGFYSLALPAGTHIITYSFLGFEPHRAVVLEHQPCHQQAA